MEVILLYFIGFLMLGITTALFIMFIDFSMNDENILDWYYVFIITKIKNPKLRKFLGECIVCYGFWIGLICFNLYYFFLFNLPFNWTYLLVIPYIGILEYVLIKTISSDSEN